MGLYMGVGIWAHAQMLDRGVRSGVEIQMTSFAKVNFGLQDQLVKNRVT